ncbi:hypothetical protein D3C76_923110 [compost metagenome]
MDLVRCPTVELKVASQSLDVLACQGDGLARVLGLDSRQFVDVLQYAIADADQDAPALGCTQLPPVSIDSSPRSLYCKIDVLRRAAGNFGIRVPRDRRVHRNALPAESRYVPAIDVVSAHECASRGR